MMAVPIYLFIFHSNDKSLYLRKTILRKYRKINVYKISIDFICWKINYFCHISYFNRYIISDW